MWRRIRLIAVREYLANVKTKTFLVAMLAVPVILVIAAAVPILLEKQRVRARPFAVLAPGAPGVRDALRAAFDGSPEIQERFTWLDPEPAPATRDDADRWVAEERLFAYLWLPDDVEAAGKATYGARNLADPKLYQWAQGELARIIRDRRFDAEHVSPYAKERILRPITLERRAVDERGASKTASALDLLRAYSPMLFVYLLFLAVLTVAQMLLMNVIEEKASRVIEVLLSSVSAGELMAGKITGVAATGITMVAAWLASLLAFVRWGVPLMAAQPGPFSADNLFALAWSVLTARNLTFFVVYGLLGFFLLSAIFAAIGSLFESIKDAQNLQMPVIYVLMVPVLTMTFITQHPHEPLGVVLSFVPPFTPFVMMNRVAAIPSAPTWEIAATLVLLVVSVALAYRLAGRVFRVGILMTGKPPTPREIWRMLWTR